MCCFNAIGGDADAPVPILVKDALGAKHGEYEMVLTNPLLLEKKSSITIVNEAGDEGETYVDRSP